MAEDLLDTIGQLFGPMRGGLAYAGVFVGALLAATTGVVAASVISMGLISLPIMLRYGYDKRLATGIRITSYNVCYTKLLRAINPDINIVPLPERLSGSSLDALVASADIVLDCTDNFSTRHALNRACVAHRKPLVS